jgi:hypothetical protein
LPETIQFVIGVSEKGLTMKRIIKQVSLVLALAILLVSMAGASTPQSTSNSANGDVFMAQDEKAVMHIDAIKSAFSPDEYGGLAYDNDGRLVFYHTGDIPQERLVSAIGADAFNCIGFVRVKFSVQTLNEVAGILVDKMDEFGLIKIAPDIRNNKVSVYTKQPLAEVSDKIVSFLKSAEAEAMKTPDTKLKLSAEPSVAESVLIEEKKGEFRLT